MPDQEQQEPMTLREQLDLVLKSVPAAVKLSGIPLSILRATHYAKMESPKYALFNFQFLGVVEGGKVDAIRDLLADYHAKTVPLEYVNPEILELLEDVSAKIDEIRKEQNGLNPEPLQSDVDRHLGNLPT